MRVAGGDNYEVGSGQGHPMSDMREGTCTWGLVVHEATEGTMYLLGLNVRVQSVWIET